MINPKMGSRRSTGESISIADALFPRVRQRVLGLLFANPERSFFGNEIVGLVQSGTGAVQREVASLVDAGLLIATVHGNQKHFRANKAAPVYEELRGLVLKTSGAVDVLRSALASVAAQIDLAFVYGSVAKLQDTGGSDVDLLVVSDSLAYADLFSTLEPASERLGRKVSPTLYSRAEMSSRVHKRNAFATRVLAGDKLWVIGNGQTLNELLA